MGFSLQATGQIAVITERTTKNDSLYVAISMVNNNRVKGNEYTDWLNFTCWGKPAEFAAKHLKKGMTIQVQLRLNTKNHMSNLNAYKIQILGWVPKGDGEVKEGPAESHPDEEKETELTEAIPEEEQAA